MTLCKACGFEVDGTLCRHNSELHNIMRKHMSALQVPDKYQKWVHLTIESCYCDTVEELYEYVETRDVIEMTDQLAWEWAQSVVCGIVGAVLTLVDNGEAV